MTIDSPMQRPPADTTDSDYPALAPWPHTVAIIALFIGWCIIGGLRAHTAATSPHILAYLSSIMAGWMSLGAVVAGIYHRRRFFFNTLQRAAHPWYIELGRGISIYFGAIALFLLIHSLLRFTPSTPAFDHSILLAMAPKNIREMLMWTLVSITAGFCEEHVFRGYLLTQLIAWTRTLGVPQFSAITISILATSVLFGSLHLYEGVEGAIMIGCLGAFYAILALRLRNLRAVIVAHFLQDLVTAALLLSHHASSH